MAGQYHAVEPNGQHNIELQFQNSASRAPSPPPRQYQGLLARRRPKARVWLGLCGKWLITIMFIVVVYIVLIGYALYDVMTSLHKKYFNALITGFLIALGMSTMSQLTHAVGDMRWWILSKRPRSRQKVKAILHVNSMSQVIVLAFKSKRWTIHLGVIAWVALFLATQVGYASLGLCYSVEKTEDTALLVPGNVSIADLSNVSTISVVKGSASTYGQEYAVNSYGIISQGLNQGALVDIPFPETLFFGDDKHFFCDEYCSYVFRETNTATQNSPTAAPISAYTDRKVDIKTQCKAYKVREGGNGTRENIVIEDGRNTRNITFPSKEGPNFKVYMTSGSQDCGSDCSHVSVFEPSLTDPWFYNCTVKMGTVENAKRPEHQVSDRLAHLVTAAIALGGLEHANNTRTNSYPSESVFGVPLNGSTGVAEYLISRFSTGALAATIEANTDVVLPGQAPTVGQKLSISHWGVMTLIFFITAILQLVVAIVAAKVSGRVVVPPSDTLSEAKVLRAMVEQDLLDEEPKDPAAAEKGKSLWIYRSTHVGDGVYDLYMEEVKT